jgi:formylglycine-generating enzyme
MWPEADRWRAPVNDFPPRWANAWGDDQYGLWADLTVNGVTQCMRWIEPGSFVMGSSDSERRNMKGDSSEDEERLRGLANSAHEIPQHTVEISTGFWLADTPCAQAFWFAIIGFNPSQFHEGEGAELRPVENVDWNAVTVFLAALASLVPEASVTLPTEAQWEYACRADTQTAYWWGNEADKTRANISHALQRTSEVKRYAANPWGLFDVHGNVWEWCADSPRDYSFHSNPDPKGSEDRAVRRFRVRRGGAWDHSAGYARSAYRSVQVTLDTWDCGGFRLALMSPTAGR